jgi:Cysteine-rich CWC
VSGNGNAAGAVGSPTGQRKTCPVCGASFGCAAPDPTCWCADVKLSSEVAAELRAQFSGCLCPRCLALAADRGAGASRGGENPPENSAR